VIRIDAWGGKNRPERSDRSLPTQSGIVLPFYKKAQKFEFLDEKKPAAFRTPVRMGSGMVEQQRIEPTVDEFSSAVLHAFHLCLFRYLPSPKQLLREPGQSIITSL
jgi:hypothetical protein